MPGIDQLWVPLISHYRDEGSRVQLDRERMAAHVRQLRPFARQYLLAGSTGDGWEMNDAMVGELVDFASNETFAGAALMFGALGHTTDEVIARAEVIESYIERSPSPDVKLAGLAVCPQVSPRASQDEVLKHYEAVLTATRLPIAAYELPQVTGCSIEPETMRELAAHPRVVMCKDTSGADRIAREKLDAVLLVRGAEGNYVEALRGGGYNGLLLSSGNNFSATLRQILTCLDTDLLPRAESLSDILTKVIEGVFSLAEALPFGNPFSNANKGVDHLLAHGPDWSEHALPLTISGNRLPRSFLEELDHCCLDFASKTAGYIHYPELA